MRMNALRKVRNSIFNTVSFSVSCLSRHRPETGNSNAYQAFNVQASDAITMYAQLLSRVSTGE